MDETKYQVFVSSTYKDLINARKKVIETVLSLYHFPVGMEMFSADDSEQWEIIRETIDVSDYYVVVIGHKYGSLSESGLSYTEREYDYAKSLGIPVLAFIRNRELPTHPDEREDNPESIIKLNKFIQKAQANKMCDFWDQIDDLATKVAIALPKIMRRNPRVGWVRGDQATPKEVSNELAELSTENRSLRERVREYESQLLSDSPVLNLSMIEGGLNLNIASNYQKQPYFTLLKREDVPSEYNDFISDSDISEYNNGLPKNDLVDRHNRRMFLYECCEKHSITLVPNLKNNGRKVATDIHIDIEIPDFLVALQNSNNDIFNNMPVLKSPDSPIERERRKESARKFFSDLRLGFLADRDLTSKVNLSEFPSLLTGNYLKNLTPLNASDWVVHEKGRVILRAKKLIQSLSMSFDEITLIPIAEGEGVINIKIVCEELKEPILFSHHVTVSALN